MRPAIFKATVGITIVFMIVFAFGGGQAMGLALARMFMLFIVGGIVARIARLFVRKEKRDSMTGVIPGFIASGVFLACALYYGMIANGG